MSAPIHNFKIHQGDTWTFSLVWKDSAGVVVNLTGYACKIQVRTTADAASALLTLDTDNPVPADGSITITAAAGKIEVTAKPAKTSTFPAGTHVYDLQVSKDGVITTLLRGDVLVIAEVTR